MVQLSFFLLGLVASAVEGASLQKRIAQTISASTAQWEQACRAAGGDLQCNPLSVAAFSALLAGALVCDQQNAADNMMTLAKSLKNNTKLIALTQIFAQQPRNTPTSQSVPYCQQAPKNAELNGLFQCQFTGANPNVFVGGIALGQTGTIPLGRKAPLSPLGSCPAHAGGPIADGTQLVDLTQNPGVGNGGASSQSPPASALPAVTDVPASGKVASSLDTAQPSTATSGMVASSPSTPQPSAAAAAGGFKLQNGLDAQKLNVQFTTLTANSPCTAGTDACVGNSFAQCVDGKFATTPCGATLICAALPLVNKPGTSITCTTPADAAARIETTGATGGITGG